MRTVGMYVKEHIKDMCLYIGFIGVFAVVFYLYGIRTDAVRYAFLLSVIWLVIYGVVDFARHCKKHRKLMEAEQGIQSEWTALPAAQSVVEEDYQRMLAKLYTSRKELLSDSRIARQEMLNYYSLWAHQIKTPIAAMRILLQADEEGSPDGGSDSGDTIQCRKELKMELFKIEQYVEMVLSYLRMEDMSSDMILQWYPADDMIRQAVKKYSQMFILRKISLDFRPSGEMILTDEKWLVFVLEQLLSNALKYTKKGKITIYMEEDTGKQPTAKQVLVIEDTGIGIQAEDLPRVFEKGFTGYNGRSDKKSTGIGLYLCKTVLKRLGHDISIESEVGKGTKVSLSLGREEVKVE